MVPGGAIPSPRSGSGSAWVEHSTPPRPASGRAGCATGVMDRGQRSAVQYVGEEPIRVLGSVDYDVEGQVETRSWGGTTGLLDESFDYDIRNRPIAHEAVRAPTMGAMAGTIGAVEYVAREQFGWDVGSNLVKIRDTRPVEQWAEGHRPRNTYIGHDSLYRVAQVSYEYRDETGYGTDTSTDWRDDAAGPNGQDPGDRTPRAGARSATSTGRTRQPRPASMIGQSHGERIQQLDYEWDYLGNQIRWLDDAFEAESRGEMFYERGIGEITNGNSTGASAGSLRPSALYLSTNIDTTGGVDPSWNGAGWVEVDYGISGNVASFTVHGQCHDNGALECSDSTGTLTSRAAHLRANCACAEEQHYRYRWDELNRLVEGLRYDRATGGSWTYGARMRYRYDGANQRTVKQSFAATDVNTPERHALYVYPGDFERRGLTVGFGNGSGNVGPTYLATTGTADATETQYLIADARIVWDGEPGITGPGIDRNRRATVNASDLLGTTAASLDLESGALLEVSTYYPNGARENLWADGTNVPLEPMGFTGKEADEEIGVTYFGERWLIPRLGRWATPDPLHVHASGGGEALNSYHYVSGNLLQARDPVGLLPDQPGNQATTATYAALFLFRSPRVPGLSLLDFVRESPNIRPLQVEAMARSSTLALDGRFRGAVGEFVALGRVLTEVIRVQGATGEVSSVGLAQMMGPLMLQGATGVGRQMYDFAIPLVNARCECSRAEVQLAGVLSSSDLARGNTLAPGPHSLGRGIGGALSVEVTLARTYQLVLQRARRVGAAAQLARAAGELNAALLVIDRDVWTSFSEPERRTVLAALGPGDRGFVAPMAGLRREAGATAFAAQALIQGAIGVQGMGGSPAVAPPVAGEDYPDESDPTARGSIAERFPNASGVSSMPLTTMPPRPSAPAGAP